jgi:hypothetical protein
MLHHARTHHSRLFSCCVTGSSLDEAFAVNMFVSDKECLSCYRRFAEYGMCCDCCDCGRCRSQVSCCVTNAFPKAAFAVT